MKIDIKKFTYVTGLVGGCVIILISVITALLYHGTKGENYSPLNHFISELGQRGVSEYAGVFNIGLIIGGLLYALFMIGLGLYIKKFYSYIASAVWLVFFL